MSPLILGLTRKYSAAALPFLVLVFFLRSEGKPHGAAATTPDSPYTSDLATTAKLSPEDFAPDGNLEKQVWKEAEWVRFDHDVTGQKEYPQAGTEVAALWTPTRVYFAFRSKYSTLNIYAGEDPSRERWELWGRDVVEVFANPTPQRVNHYYEFEVAPNNQWVDLEIDKDKTPSADARWDSHFDHATRLDPTHQVWTAELRIPVASMGVRRMETGAEWRINYYRLDGPSAGRRLLSWSPIPEGESFHTPTRFGIIRFVR